MGRKVSGAVAGILLSGTSLAAGFTFGDNGSVALSQGGAFVGQADDTSAIQYNPAGLAQLSGIHFHLDSNLANHEVTFQRLDLSEFDKQKADPNYRPLSVPVTNQAGLFLLPGAAVGYGTLLGGRNLTVAVGFYAPPSVGRYAFNAPNYTQEGSKYVENPRKFAPQRYSLIKNDQLIAFPSVTAAYQIHPRFSAGVSFQYVVSHVQLQQSVYSGLATPRDQFEEDPDFDSIVDIDMKGKPTFTAMLGVMAKPTDTLQFGASFRPPVKLDMSGTMIVRPGEIASQLATVNGNAADLELTLPMELRVGAMWRPIPEAHVNADFVYEGWQSVQELRLTPRDISITILNTTTDLAPIRIPKNFHHTKGVRLGGGYKFKFGLSARAGVLFEEAASEVKNTSIDFLHFTRAFLTAGVGYELGPVTVNLGGAYLPTGERTVNAATGTEVLQVNTDSKIPSAPVGYGTYSSGGWIATVGVRGKFGGASTSPGASAPITSENP